VISGIYKVCFHITGHQIFAVLCYGFHEFLICLAPKKINKVAKSQLDNGFCLCQTWPNHWHIDCIVWAIMRVNVALEDMVYRQTTLRRAVRIEGVGLHSGRQVKMILGPAACDSGVSFERSDLSRRPVVSVCPENIRSSRLCTVVDSGDAQVSTVEHLLSALSGLGIDNAHVVLNGDELPILDGSAGPFVDLIQQAGSCEQDEMRSFLKIKTPVAVRDGDRVIKIAPSKSLSVSCSLDFDHPLISKQHHYFVPYNGTFLHEVAPARTFGFYKDAKALRMAGLARGASLDNTIVVGKYSVMNPDGLRYSDEFVRHKVLDILGDLALLGHPLLGKVRAYKSGHQLHHKLIQKLVTTPDCIALVQPTPHGKMMELPFEPLSLPGLQSA
jgi:UDP-3-O-[3-hydroxymyristoyl] N-acetylglucosamine deacetylase